MSLDTRTPERRRTESGTALIEMVVLGFAIVALVLPAVSAVVHLADASARASAVAHDTAVAVARHGSAPPHTGAARIELTTEDDRIVVVATVDVTVLSMPGLDVTISVAERASMSPSPYRSGR